MCPSENYESSINSFTVNITRISFDIKYPPLRLNNIEYLCPLANYELFISIIKVDIKASPQCIVSLQSEM